MSQTDTIRAIIAEHRGQSPGAVFLVNAIRARLPDDASDDDVETAIGFCREILDAVPVLLDRVREAAEDNGVAALVEPVLAHAEAYFVSPVDAMSEALFGELGLLDDAYLALSVIRLLQTEPQPLIAIDLDPPLSFLEQILGADVLARLQAEKAKAVQALIDGVEQLAAEADARRRREAAARSRPQPRPARTAVPSATSGRRQCGACSGTGTVTCSSCGGYGSHTTSSTRIDWQGDVEYVTEHVPCGCAGGRSTCGGCGGAGFVTA